MRVLIVEDERPLARALEIGLRREAIAVDLAPDGAVALERLRVYDYDAVVLDRDLPVVHGDEVCRRIVAEGSGVRVLMLTAAGTTGDRIEGLGLGADDYLAKPFDFDELVARLRALYRRAPMAYPPELALADLRFDTHRRRVTRAGRTIALTPKESAVLELLLRADGGVLSLGDLLDKAWSLDSDAGDNAVRLVVHALRRKLGDPPLLHTAVGAGYYLQAP
ncbi:response regulator transcription factor [Kitasatospora sp. HPMI-4]|uniref:response regulator transcription factor n=1 Tax=Kitasatospora sp. HPMI-4 TaxID=3448443 RepID=UPI003F1DA217